MITNDAGIYENLLIQSLLVEVSFPLSQQEVTYLVAFTMLATNFSKSSNNSDNSLL